MFAISVLFAGVAWQVLKDREAAIERAERTTQQLALALEAGTIGTLRSAERVAHHVGTVTLGGLDSDGNPTDQALAFWRQQLIDVPFLHAISFIKPDGSIPATAFRSDANGVQLVRETFDGSSWSAYTTHLIPGADRLFVGLPITSFFIPEKWILPLTLPQRDASGRLLGIVYVDIALTTFLDLFSEVRSVGRSSITVFDRSGTLVFSAPFMEQIVGNSFADVDLFTKHLENSPVGTYQSLTRFTRDARILTYRALEGWPLVLTFDFSLSEVFAPLRQRAVYYFLAALGASVVILLLTLWLSRQFRQDEQTRVKLTYREKSLEESQRLAGVGHFERDIKTGRITWAENMYAIHGVSPEKFIPGRDAFLDLVSESERDVIRDHVYRYDHPPSNGHLECQIIRQDDGSLHDMVYDWEIIYGRDGVPVSTFGVARDVTSLKATARTIHENEMRLQDITECVSDFIWEVDAEGVVTHFESGSMDPLLNIELGVTKDENIDFEVGAGDHALIEKAFADGAAFRNLTVPLKNRDQQTRWVRISGNPRFDSDGQFMGFRGAGSDVTEQRQQGIYEIEKTKSEALARLAGGMAHEINNLLQPVVVYSSMGENGSPDRLKSSEYFKKIFAASQQAIRIVQDVLTFAREGRSIPVPMPLGTVLHESIEMLKPTLPAGIEIVGPPIDESVNVSAHSGGLHQIVINLVRNAVDAVSGKGTIKFDVGAVVINSTDATHRGVAPGDYGYFSIIDDGPGLDEDVLLKIYDPFFSTKPTGLGTGLGLSVVAGLVKGWGGAVDASSRPGHTVFTVYIPLVSAVQRAAE